MGVIFDLDNTLLYTDCAFLLRNERKWSEVYKKIKDFYVYDGIYEMLEFLVDNNIDICIVTSSPKSYCEKVVKQFKFPIKNMVCYHDTKNHKPHPEPILKAVSLMRNSNKIISFGDDVKDIQSSNSANIISVACLWGANDKGTLLKASPCHTANTVFDALDLIKQNLNNI